MTPSGAQIFFQGSYYKIGRCDRVFIFINGEWMSSQKPIDAVREAIKTGLENDYSTYPKRITDGEYEYIGFIIQKGEKSNTWDVCEKETMDVKHIAFKLSDAVGWVDAK